jgi:hypothetical protein
VNTEKVSDWLQIVASFGVVVSLVFVGLQLRQTQEIALSQTYQGRTANTVETNIGSINSPAFLSGMAKLYTRSDNDLTMQEAVALEYHMGTVLTMLENNHLQYQQGFLSEEHWQRNLDELRCQVTVPFLREIATAWPLRDSFDAVIAEVIRESQPDDNCWYWGWDYPVN